jgi:hypothetical protein
MKRTILSVKPTTGYIPIYDGESIETKIERVVQNKEPIEDGAEIIYTEKNLGVQPQYDIRTDKWEVAQEAMNLAHANRIAKSNGTLEQWQKEQQEKNTKNE